MATIVTIPRTSLTTPFSTMAGELSTQLIMCPVQLIAQTVRTVVIDLCQRGKVWEVDLSAIELIPDQVNYALETGVDGAEVTDLLYGCIRGDQVCPIGVAREDQVLREYPDWPHTASAQVRYVVPKEIGTVWCAPAPAEAGQLELRAILRPTLTATSWDSDLYAEFKRLIHHGVLHTLMLMPKKEWSDEKMAAYHGRQWTYLLSMARARSNQKFNVGDLAVTQRPFA